MASFDSRYLCRSEATGGLEFLPSANCDSDDHVFYGTPPKWIQLIKEVMGSIELDPASCIEANTAIVKADRFYSKEDDGLAQPWACKTLFVNPPWKKNTKTSALWARKFAEEFDAQHIQQAVVLINCDPSTEAWQSYASRADMVAFPTKRIEFIPPGTRVSTKKNTNPQVFFYFGRRWRKFVQVFTDANCLVMRPENV